METTFEGSILDNSSKITGHSQIILLNFCTCRWKRNISGDKVIKDGKPVLEFVAVERRDC